MAWIIHFIIQGEEWLKFQLPIFNLTMSTKKRINPSQLRKVQNNQNK